MSAAVVLWKKEKARKTAMALNEKYENAIDLLISSSSSSRAGAILDLFDVADASVDYRQLIIDALCAYLRTLSSDTDNPSVEAPIQTMILNGFSLRLRAEREELRAQGKEGLAFPDLWSQCDFDFHGAIFYERVDLSSTSWGKPVDFSGVSFDKGVGFQNTHFAVDANFSEAKFGNSTWFDEVVFGGQVRFDSALFGDGTWFDESIFVGPAHFDYCRFGKRPVFAGSHFRSDVSFTDASFGSHAWFDETVFDQKASFNKASFGADARFALCQFRNEASFDGSSFAAPPFLEGMESANSWPTGIPPLPASA